LDWLKGTMFFLVEYEPNPMNSLEFTHVPKFQLVG
jgi:hypothetical protein